ncbi:hypothetical protein FISHEDRAFT_57800 [Fistulina hepatica ATCC 64428]|uniref:Uncharacterized protein n=1 Tax=Fistulina hepatica ATCC 64428 TaxID=1128425 RepID=A0A0D7AFJ8_9AGAR|nr:hypothetical protein FISHEDRAFT_57800 [Fistulina hepatica ATCC 64428]
MILPSTLCKDTPLGPNSAIPSEYGPFRTATKNDATTHATNPGTSKVPGNSCGAIVCEANPLKQTLRLPRKGSKSAIPDIKVIIRLLVQNTLRICFTSILAELKHAVSRSNTDHGIPTTNGARVEQEVVVAATRCLRGDQTLTARLSVKASDEEVEGAARGVHILLERLAECSSLEVPDDADSMADVQVPPEIVNHINRGTFFTKQDCAMAKWHGYDWSLPKSLATERANQALAALKTGMGLFAENKCWGNVELL